MYKDDLTRVRHILDAANDILDFTTGQSRSDLDTDRKLNLALVRLLEIIGEAANGISNEFQEMHPDIPWRQMSGMRNRLIHGYFDVNLDTVWVTVTQDIQPLVVALNKTIQ